MRVVKGILKANALKTLLFAVVFSLIFSSISFAETYTVTVDSWKDYKEAIKRGIENQEEVIRIKYVGDEKFASDEEVVEKIRSLYEEALEELGYFDSQNVFKTSPAKGSRQLEDGTHALTIGQYKVTYKNTKEEIKEINRIINDFVNNNITDNMSDYDKIKAAYNFVLDSYKYKKHATNNNDIDNLLKERKILTGLNGEGVVCDAYSMLFAKLMDSLGYENVIVTGNADGTHHAWNSVKVGDKWYNVDPTWADMEIDEEVQKLLEDNPDLDEEFIREFVEQKAQEKKSLYFLTSDEVLKETHKWDETKAPSAPKAYEKDEVVEEPREEKENESENNTENNEKIQEKNPVEPKTVTEIKRDSIRIKTLKVEDVDKNKIIKIGEDKGIPLNINNDTQTQPMTVETKTTNEADVETNNASNTDTIKIDLSDIVPNIVPSLNPSEFKININIVK